MNERVSQEAEAADFFNLCGNCGEVRAVEQYGHFIHVEGELVPAPKGQEVTAERCPACGFDHTDDDAGPGLWGGSRAAMEAERETLLKDPIYADTWIETWKERAALPALREQLEAEVREGLLSDEAADSAARDAYEAWNGAGSEARFANWDLLPDRVQKIWIGIAYATVEAALDAAFPPSPKEDTDAA